MCAHEDARGRYLAKQRVEDGAIAAVLDRIHPDENAIGGEELPADRVAVVVVVRRRRGNRTKRGERIEHAGETARLALARVQDCNSRFAGRFQGSLHTDMHRAMANVEQRLDAEASGTGRLPDPLPQMLANRVAAVKCFRE